MNIDPTNIHQYAIRQEMEYLEEGEVLLNWHTQHKHIELNLFFSVQCQINISQFS